MNGIGYPMFRQTPMSIYTRQSIHIIYIYIQKWLYAYTIIWRIIAENAWPFTICWHMFACFETNTDLLCWTIGIPFLSHGHLVWTDSNDLCQTCAVWFLTNYPYIIHIYIYSILYFNLYTCAHYTHMYLYTFIMNTCIMYIYIYIMHWMNIRAALSFDRRCARTRHCFANSGWRIDASGKIATSRMARRSDDPSGEEVCFLPLKIGN